MKKVLVAEDEQAIREFVVINLKRAGYEAYEASNGEEALETYEREGKDFDVAILDIMMPGNSMALPFVGTAKAERLHWYHYVDGAHPRDGQSQWADDGGG